MSNPVKPDESQIEFAKELGDKLYWKYSRRQFYLSDLVMAVRDMVSHKLAKEKWTKPVDKI